MAFSGSEKPGEVVAVAAAATKFCRYQLQQQSKLDPFPNPKINKSTC